MESLAEVKVLLSGQTKNVGVGDEVKGETGVEKMSEVSDDAKNVVKSGESGLLNGEGSNGDLDDVIIIDSDLSGSSGRVSGLKRKREIHYFFICFKFLLIVLIDNNDKLISDNFPFQCYANLAPSLFSLGFLETFLSLL